MRDAIQGVGTWMYGEDERLETEEIAVIRKAIESGLGMIDTAEMYGEGSSERLISKAIQGIERASLTLISKVLPENARTSESIRNACLGSLQRLNTNYLDVYLLHWKTQDTDLKIVVDTFESLKRGGFIKSWGVSNFDIEDLEALWRIPGGNQCQYNQVLYHLGSRGIETALLKWHHHHGIKTMVYSPLGHNVSIRNDIVNHPLIQELSQKYSISPVQIMFKCAMRLKDVIVLPRTSKVSHFNELTAVHRLDMEDYDWKRLDQAFPVPIYRMPLDEI